MSYILRPYPDVIKEAIGRIVKEEIKKPMKEESVKGGPTCRN